jgi:hypothetical protein
MQRETFWETICIRGTAWHYTLPPSIPDVMPCEFFLCSFIKDRVFVPLPPVIVKDLKQIITTAVASVDEDMLRCVRTSVL